MTSREMTCAELSEAVTAYFDRALARSARDRFEAHRSSCPRCQLLVEEWQAMVGSLARLSDRSTGVTGPDRERLLALFREHGFHRPGRPVPRIPLGLDSGQASPGDHIACLCESDRDFSDLAGFVAAGAARGETCLLLLHEDARSRLEAAIQRAGIDAPALGREDRLLFVPAMRSADALLAEIGEQVKAAVDRGAPLVRIVGNLGWGLPEWPGETDLLRLEARATDAVRILPVVLMCAYDVRGSFGRGRLRGLECHPLTYGRGGLRPNGLYVPAESFLARLSDEG